MSWRLCQTAALFPGSAHVQASPHTCSKKRKTRDVFKMNIIVVRAGRLRPVLNERDVLHLRRAVHIAGLLMTTQTHAGLQPSGFLSPLYCCWIFPKPNWAVRPGPFFFFFLACIGWTHSSPLALTVIFVMCNYAALSSPCRYQPI